MKDRNIAIVREAEQKLVKPLRVLNEYLTGKDFLVADQFTVADINLAGVLSYAQGGEFDFSPYSKVAQYLEVVLSRPTYKKVVAG